VRPRAQQAGVTRADAERGRLVRADCGDPDPAAPDVRVVALACQLKVADRSDWNRPVWLARVPEGQRLQVGDVVRLRTGAAEHSKDVDPLAQVIGPAGGVAPSAGPGVVRCH
jgi:hypothetical protein